MTRYISRGVTLIEMMIVIAILSILLAVAAPNFSNLIISNQISGNASDFVDTLRIAKKEASARRITVAICVRNGNNCNLNNGTWDDGWLVFLDNNGNDTLDNGEIVIYQYDALNPQITFTAVDGNGNALRRLSFTPSGNTNLTGSGAATFTIGDQDGTIAPRSFSVTVAGHASPL